MIGQRLPLAITPSSRVIEAPVTSLTDFEPRTHSLSPLERAQSGLAGLKVRAGGPARLKVADGDGSPGEGQL